MRHFAISAANISISTLVLWKWHMFNRKRRYSQVNKHRNEIKTILHTNFKQQHVWSAEKNDSHDTQEISLISLIEWDLYNECLQCLTVPPVFMQACRCLRKLVIGLKNTPYDNLNIYKPA